MTRGRKLYLDKENGKIAGVCAGLADYFGKDVTMVRIIYVIATCIWPPIMICAYIFMAWLLDPKPGMGFASAGFSGPWPTDPGAPRRRLIDVKDRFDRLDMRLRALEAVVTSPAYRIDRELRA
jgi:phage shock protein C